MIALFDKDGAKLSISYRSLVLNDATDSPSDTYEVWQAMIDAEHGAIAEPKSERDGSEIYRPKKQRRIIRIEGAVKAPTAGELFDKAEALAAAFDPVNAYLADLDSTSDVGFLPLTFSRPTADTTNYATGLKLLQYYARPLAIPITRITKKDGKAARFAVLMECADPRAYARSASTASRTDSGALTLDNTLASYSSYPIITVTLSDVTGVVEFERVANKDTSAVQIDFTGLAIGDEVVIDMERRYVTLNGSAAMDLVVVDEAAWWEIFGDESQTLNVTDISGDTLSGDVEVSWVKAFA